MKYARMDIVIAVSELVESIVDHLSLHAAVPARFSKASQHPFEQ